MGSGASRRNGADNDKPVPAVEPLCSYESCGISSSPGFTALNPSLLKDAAGSRGSVTLNTDNLETSSESSSDTESLDFHEALAAAAQQLHIRQRDGNPNLTKEEMKDLVMVTREMENLKQMMKRSQYTVTGTWAIIESEGMLERFGQQLYDELLTRSAHLRVYFYGVDLGEQSRTLLRMIGTAVHFYEKPEVTVDMLTKAGARHRGYGISYEVFAEMEKSFLKVFPKFVGLDVFEAAEEEWKKFWKLVLDLLKHGNTSAEGDRYGKLHEEQTVKKLQADFKVLTERQAVCETRQQFVGVMYAKAIELYGDLSKFEALKDLRASTLVFQSIYNIILNMADREKLQQYMLELGARHMDYNVTPEHLVSFTDPFIFACRHFLQEEWNVAMETRFQWVFRYMVEGISEGMRERMQRVKKVEANGIRSAPVFCLVFTDIEASSKLWKVDPTVMSLAVKNHHRIVRQLIADYGAYEVKTVESSFIIAAKDMLVGAKVALAIQLELLRAAPIAQGFKMVSTTEGRGDESCWNEETLRVRIGVEHSIDATATYDAVHRRYDYYGPSVNRCAQMKSAACGGQILMSRESFEQLKAIPEFHDEPCPTSFRSVDPSKAVEDNLGLDHFVAVSDVGRVALKGVSEPVHLVSMVPSCLSGRLFIDKIGQRGARTK